MIENKKFSFTEFIVSVLIVLFLGLWAGVEITSAAYNASAIKAGVGKYKIIDPTTGEIEFVWVTNSIPVK
jgi:hypothetical protein